MRVVPSWLTGPDLLSRLSALWSRVAPAEQSTAASAICYATLAHLSASEQERVMRTVTQLLGGPRGSLRRDLRRRVRDRDGDRCRYCGRAVDWTAFGAEGGTLDHVDPWAGNVPDNLVVACRGCNAAKGRRTPEQAGMALVP